MKCVCLGRSVCSLHRRDDTQSPPLPLQPPTTPTPVCSLEKHTHTLIHTHNYTHTSVVVCRTRESSSVNSPVSE